MFEAARLRKRPRQAVIKKPDMEPTLLAQHCLPIFFPPKGLMLHGNHFKTGQRVPQMLLCQSGRAWVVAAGLRWPRNCSVISTLCSLFSGSGSAEIQRWVRRNLYTAESLSPMFDTGPYNTCWQLVQKRDFCILERLEHTRVGLFKFGVGEQSNCCSQLESSYLVSYPQYPEIDRCCSGGHSRRGCCTE